MMNRWQQFTAREKQIVTIGSIVLIMVLLYWLMWSPLTSKVTDLRVQLQHNQSLLAYMQAVDKQLAESHSSKLAKNSMMNVSFLNTLQRTIKQPPLAAYPAEIKQTDSDSVELHFQEVSFDDLIQWLTSEVQQYHWIIKQVTITHGASLGMVSATLLLTR